MPPLLALVGFDGFFRVPNLPSMSVWLSFKVVREEVPSPLLNVTVMVSAVAVFCVT